MRMVCLPDLPPMNRIGSVAHSPPAINGDALKRGCHAASEHRAQLHVPILTGIELFVEAKTELVEKRAGKRQPHLGAIQALKRGARYMRVRIWLPYSSLDRKSTRLNSSHLGIS